MNAVAALEWWWPLKFASNFLDLNDSNATAKASETTAVAFTTIRNKVTILELQENQNFYLICMMFDVQPCPYREN